MSYTTLSISSGDDLLRLVLCIVLDFSDAFKQLHVYISEQGFLTGSCTQGFFAYLRILFGVVSGPLVWGRVAACVMRASQSLAIHDNIRENKEQDGADDAHLALACFVDDRPMDMREQRSHGLELRSRSTALRGQSLLPYRLIGV